MVKGTRRALVVWTGVLVLLLSGCTVNFIASTPTNAPVTTEGAATGENTTTITESPSSGETDDSIPPGNGRVAIVGDSLTLGADRHGGLVPRLEELGWEVSFDAVEGRTTQQGVAALEEMLATNPDPDTVVVGLGTNDRDEPEEFRALVKRVVELTEDSRLLWMTIEWDQRSQLQDVLDEYQTAGDLTQIDFRPVIAAQSDLVGSDGIHFTEVGYAARATTMLQAIGEP